MVRQDYSESSETVSPRVTLPFNEDSSYVYNPIPTRMNHKKPAPLEEEDPTEYDEEASASPPRTTTATTATTKIRGNSTSAWIARRLYTSNGWRLISACLITPCSSALCSSRTCRYFYQKGKCTPLGRDMVQVLLSICIFNLLPMFLYFLFDLAGLNVSFGVYVATMIFLVTMSFLLVTECIFAFGHNGPPNAPGVPETPASAIICAYLPNEAEIIVETVEHFLNLEYEPGIQIILTYNTPMRIPAIEEQLEVLANRFPNLLVLCVEHSTSKAQNLNAALDFVVGDFVGVFDADHRPEVHSFSRAWRWLSNGYDVVQGHGVSRNPDASWMARMVAVEAECKFAVSEPGRATRDAVGFYHSNGYWKSPLLKRVGMVASMLAEDVDAGMMALGEGCKIAMDPRLISFELSTTTAFQTWNQRLRLSQGWFQVSMRHCFPLLFSPSLGLRSKLGIFLHLNVREMFPWFSSQVFTLVFYWIVTGENRHLIRPLLLAYMAYLLVAGPLTAIAAYCLCHPTLRNPWWFLQYSVFHIFVYMNAKGLCARMGHIKQAFGENAWRVTPRSTRPTHIAAVQEDRSDQTPKETEVKAIGEPSMTVLTLQKVAQSTTKTMSRIVQESRSLFQAELERADRSRHHFSRHEEESVMIANNNLHHRVKRCDWSYSVSHFESTSIVNRDNSQSDVKGMSHEHIRMSNNPTSIIEDIESPNKRRKVPWSRSNRASTVDQSGGILSQSSDDSRSRVSVDWSFQNMSGDYSVSVQPADYSVMKTTDQSVSLPHSDQSDSIQTADMSGSQNHQHKPRTTRFQKVFNLSILLSGSVSSKDTSERSTSRSSHHSDYSKSIDEYGPGMFWSQKPHAASNADDHSNSTISEAGFHSQKEVEIDLEKGLEEHPDVKRIRAQNEADRITSPEKANPTVSSNTRKGFSLDPPSSSIPAAAMSLRPDPPLKERSVQVEKECTQTDLTRQPVKERYWKKRGRYWVNKNDKSGASLPPPKESEKQHRIGKDPEPSRNPQKRRHGDAPSELGRIYTIDESQDDLENLSAGVLDPDEMSSSAGSSHSNCPYGDPPAVEMRSASPCNDEISNQIVSDLPLQLSDDFRLDQHCLVKPINSQMYTENTAPEPPAKFIEHLPHQDVYLCQNSVTEENSNEAGLDQTADDDLELEKNHLHTIISMTDILDDCTPTEIGASSTIMLEKDEMAAIGTTKSFRHTSNIENVPMYSLNLPDVHVLEHTDKDTELISVHSDGMRYDKREPPESDCLQAVDQSSYSANLHFPGENFDAVEGANDVSTACELHSDVSAGSSLVQTRVESASKCSSSMYSCTSNGPEDVDQGHAYAKPNDSFSVDSILSMECNDKKYESHIERVNHDIDSKKEISLPSKSAEKLVCVSTYSGHFEQTSCEHEVQEVSEGEDFLALQQMIELEMDRDNKSALGVEETESSLKNESFLSTSTQIENAQVGRRAFFKELLNCSTPDELSEGISSRHDSPSTSRQPENVKLGEPFARSCDSFSSSDMSAQSRRQMHLPFRPPADIEVDHEASLFDSISNADTSMQSRSQSFSVPYSVDIEVRHTDENSVDSLLADGFAEKTALLKSFQTEDRVTEPESEAFVRESPKFDRKSGEQITCNLNGDRSSHCEELSKLSSEERNPDDISPSFVKKVIHKEDEVFMASPEHIPRLASSEHADDFKVLQSLEVPSDPPGDEHVALNLGSGHVDDKLILKRATITNMQLSASQSTTDEESVISEIHESISEADGEEDGHSTSWIQNLLDTMDEEIIFGDTLSPCEVFEEDEIPDLVETDTGGDTFQTVSTAQSHDEEYKNSEDFLGDEVSTVDLTVN